MGGSDQRWRETSVDGATGHQRTVRSGRIGKARPVEASENLVTVRVDVTQNIERSPDVGLGRAIARMGGGDPYKVTATTATFFMRLPCRTDWADLARMMKRRLHEEESMRVERVVITVGDGRSE